MEELPKFTTMDNHEAVQVGELEQTQESLQQPKFTSDSPEAVVRERTAELTLRREEQACCASSSTPRMWETMMGPPLVDED